MEQIIGLRPLEAWIDRDLVCVLENEEQVKAANPDLGKAKLLFGLLLQVTARGADYDCVSCSFAPKPNVPEESGLQFRALPYCTSLVRQIRIERISSQTSVIRHRSGTLTRTPGFCYAFQL